MGHGFTTNILVLKEVVMQRFITTITVILLLLQVSCDDFVNIDPPRTDIVRTSVFSEGSTAEAAVVDLYISLRDGFGGGSESSVTAMTDLSSDEWEWYGVSTSRLAFENMKFPRAIRTSRLCGPVPIPWCTRQTQCLRGWNART